MKNQSLSTLKIERNPFDGVSPEQYRHYMDLPHLLRNKNFSEELRDTFRRFMIRASDLVTQNKRIIDFEEEVGDLLEEVNLKYSASEFSITLKKEVKDFKKEAVEIRRFLQKNFSLRLEGRNPYINTYTGETTIYLYKEGKDGIHLQVQLILKVPSMGEYGVNEEDIKGACYFKEVKKEKRMVVVEDTEMKMVCPGDEDFDLEESLKENNLKENEASAHHGLTGE